MFIIHLKEGVQSAVAVKTCKEDNEDSMMEKFLEEACMYPATGSSDSIKYLVDRTLFHALTIISWYP